MQLGGFAIYFLNSCFAKSFKILEAKRNVSSHSRV
jgi:hypothetical protein